MEVTTITQGEKQVRAFLKKLGANWPLWGVVVMFIGLGLRYSLTTPLFEAPDESSHFFFAWRLARTGSIPVYQSGKSDWWVQEAGQPPLYYLLAAALIRPLDTRDAPAYLRANPQANIGDPNSPGNKNAFIHTGREQFPFRGTTLAVYLARWVSLFFGALTVVAAFWLGHDLDPRWGTPVALAVACLPQFLFLSGVCTNDTAIAATATTGLVFLLRVMRGQVNGVNVGGLSVAIGLALLAKSAGVILFVLTLYGVGLSAAAKRITRRQGLVIGGAVLGSAVVLAGWWYLRNWQLYGEWTGQRAILLALGVRTHLPATWSEIVGEFRGLVMSFWGLFGWFSILLPAYLYTGLNLIAIVALGGLALRTVQRRWEAVTAQSLLLLSAWVGLVFAGLVVWTLKALGSQGRLMFPAVGAIAVLLVAGLEAALPRRIGRWLLPAVLFLCAVLAPSLVIGPAYARPAVVTLGQIPPEASRVYFRYGADLELVAVRARAPDARPGEALDVTFYWRALRPIESDYMLHLRLLGRDLQPIAREDGYPGWGNWPTSLWRVGEIYADRYQLPVDANAAAPVLARVAVIAEDGVHPDQLPVFDRAGAAVDALAPLALVSVHRISPPPPLEHAQSAEFGDFAQLVGYDFEPAAVRPGEAFDLQLMWKAIVRPAAAYTVFVHVLNSQGRIVTGGDSPPLAGFYPTTAWLAGETFVETRSLSMPADVPPGDYHIEIGWYDSANLQRVQIRDAALGDTLILNVPLPVVAGPR